MSRPNVVGFKVSLSPPERPQPSRNGTATADQDRRACTASYSFNGLQAPPLSSPN